MTMTNAAAAAAPSETGIFGVESPHAIVHDLAKSVDLSALAASALLDRKSLYRWVTRRDNVSREHVRLPLELAPVLEIATGRTDLVTWHAEQLGGVFVRRPLVAVDVTGVVGHLAAIGSEVADVQRRSADALHDRRISPAESRAILAEVQELERAVVAYRVELEAELLRKPPVRASAR